MNRADWDTYQSARGVAKKRALAKLLVDNAAFIERACEYNLRHTQYHVDSLRADARQAAVLGFMRAVAEWDPDRGRFTVVAYGWIRHEIQQVLRDATPVTRPKDADLPRKTQNAAAAFYAKNGREPTPEEIGTTPNKIALAEKARAKFTRLRTVPEGDHTIGPTPPELQCEAFAEGPETTIDRQRDLGALRGFLRKLSATDRQEFVEGKRTDLNAQAKSYIERRRNVRRVA